MNLSIFDAYRKKSSCRFIRANKAFKIDKNKNEDEVKKTDNNECLFCFDVERLTSSSQRLA